MPPRFKAVILDRDGTLIQHIPYLSDPAQVQLLPTVAESLERLTAAGIRLFLHSNQSGVARGLFDLDAVQACNLRLCELLNLGSDPFAKVCIAPESPEVEPIYRKPSPRFASELMAEFNLQPHEVCYVGDRGSDLATAAAAGTAGIGVATGLEDLRLELQELGLAQRFPIFDTLSEAVDHILSS